MKIGKQLLRARFIASHARVKLGNFDSVTNLVKSVVDNKRLFLGERNRYSVRVSIHYVHEFPLVFFVFFVANHSA
jgi:hypothetical protein